MPLKLYKCPLCQHERETLRPRIPKCNHNQEEEGFPTPLVEMVEVMTAPNQKFMITSNPEKHTSKLKDAERILKARARNHSRDVDLDVTIQKNLDNGLNEQVARNLLNNKGQKRRKIDDI